MFLLSGLAYPDITKRANQEPATMKLPREIGDQPINKTIERHPRIGEILGKYEIGCVTCGVGICLVKDVVAIHALGDEIEARIEQEITDYLNTLTHHQQGACV